MTYRAYTNRFLAKKNLYDSTNRNRSLEPKGKGGEKEAYVKFLETHLDKLTNSVQAIDGFTERIY